MEKFLDVYGRWEQRELTQAEAAEILGRSERQFRRYIDLYESEGLDGLLDGRLGKRSPKALASPDYAPDLGKSLAVVVQVARFT